MGFSKLHIDSKNPQSSQSKKNKSKRKCVEYSRKPIESIHMACN